MVLPINLFAQGEDNSSYYFTENENVIQLTHKGYKKAPIIIPAEENTISE